MTEKTYKTKSGIIHYWIDLTDKNSITLVFLPGLTADHRLFDRQIAYFKNKYNVFVWDAPAHAASWPFTFDFDLMDKAAWLNRIFEQEQIAKPVIIGQSMGGYVGQAYAQLYPDKLKGFISIDSAPLQRKYVTGIERFFLYFGYFISVIASGFVENLILLQNLSLTEYPNMRKNPLKSGF